MNKPLEQCALDRRDQSADAWPESTGPHLMKTKHSLSTPHRTVNTVWRADDWGLFCRHRTSAPCSHWAMNTTVCKSILELNVWPKQHNGGKSCCNNAVKVQTPPIWCCGGTLKRAVCTHKWMHANRVGQRSLIKMWETDEVEQKKTLF